MGSFVQPGTTRIACASGLALTVRTRLNVGQQRARQYRMYTNLDDGRLRLNTLEIGRATVLAYLVEWTVTDDAGDPVPLRGLDVAEIEILLDNLEGDVFKEIREAIDAHEARQLAARADQKKTPDGASTSPAISPSLVAVAGGTNG